MPNIDSIKKPEGVDWVQLRKEINIEAGESTKEKFIKNFTKNPLVPIGATVTCGALSYGLYCLKQGNSQLQQKMMRLRVGAQLFTIVAAIGGIVLSLPKEDRNLAGLLKHGEKRA